MRGSSDHTPVRVAHTIPARDIEDYAAALKAARKECPFDSDSFIEEVAEQLWHRAHAARTALDNEREAKRHRRETYADPDLALRRAREIAAGRPSGIPSGLAIDVATYAWVQQHRALVRALMAGEAVVVPKA